MKNIKILGLTLAAAACLASCDMEKYPYSSIPTEKALESVADCKAFRVGLYSNLKYRFTGTNVYTPELQTDLYHAARNFGNWGGPFYYWGFQTSEGELSTLWDGSYSTIGNANFLISGIERLLASGTLSAADTKTVEEYLGEAHYIRAHMYYALAERFCEDYDPGTAADYMGVPIVTEYAPTGDATKYPARPTLEATYQFIVDELAEATKYVTATGAQGSYYVTSDVVKALRARVALMMHDFDTAFNLAKSLIDSGKYPLISDQDEYSKMWINDVSTESLWTIQMVDQSDTGYGHGYFIYNTSGEEGNDQPHYFPEDWALELFSANDIRYDAYFSRRAVEKPFVGNVVIQIKYPGNPSLYPATGGSNYVNKPKVFRISEMYLIAAEAAYNKGNQDAVGSSYLNQLKSKRIQGWSNVDYSGTDLRDEIRNERVRELYGEGFRLTDLKRWKLGFKRSSGQNPDYVMPGSNYVGLSVEAGNPRFVWPIPNAEIQANPQMEQNPGY